VSGTLFQFDCLQQGARLHVRVDGKPLVFAILKPDALTVKNESGHHDFTCGAQKPTQVTVSFEPATDPKIAGVVRMIEFK